MTAIKPDISILVYVDSDIPAGVTLTDWRRSQDRRPPRSPAAATVRRLLGLSR
jgi:hypothetical protein